MEGMLCEKLDYEFETFVCNLKLGSKDSIIARSEEIVLKRNIIQALKTLPIPEEKIWYMMAQENILDLFFRQIKEQEKEWSLVYGIWVCLENIEKREE